MSTSTEQANTKMSYKMVDLNDSRMLNGLNLANESTVEIKKKCEWLLRHYKNLLSISKQQSLSRTASIGSAIGAGKSHPIPFAIQVGTLTSNPSEKTVMILPQDIQPKNDLKWIELDPQTNSQAIMDAIKVMEQSKGGNAHATASEGGAVVISNGNSAIQHNSTTQQYHEGLLEAEILEITILTRAMYRLVDERERQLLQYRYLENAVLDYEVVKKMAVSERQYYRTKKNAILNFADCVKRMGYWVTTV